jgi:hypothetical protein
MRSNSRKGYGLSAVNSFFNEDIAYHVSSSNFLTSTSLTPFSEYSSGGNSLMESGMLFDFNTLLPDVHVTDHELSIRLYLLMVLSLCFNN